VRSEKHAGCSALAEEVNPKTATRTPAAQGPLGWLFII